jgi:hypothetical protein
MLNHIKSTSNSCLLIKNFNVIKSDTMYTNFEKEINKYTKLTLVNFIVEYYNKSAILSLFKKYGCIDYFEIVENCYKRVLQFKKILDTFEKDRSENDKIVERLTLEKCNNIINDIIQYNELKGGKPFLKFIRNIFRNNADYNPLDIFYPCIIIFILCTLLEFVDHRAARFMELGFFLVPAIERLLRAWRVRNIPDNVFNILYNLVFRNTVIQEQDIQMIRFNQYAQWHIDGIDLLEWIPTFGNQMIPSHFHHFQITRLRRITSELNLFRDLVMANGWIALSRDNIVTLDFNLALRAHMVDVSNNRVNPMQHHPEVPADYLIIRRASNIADNIGNENRCNICWEDLIESNSIDDTKNENGYLVRLHQQIDGVAHLFHFKCIKNWFLRGNNRSCPLCRQDIDCSRILVDENIPENEDGVDFFDVPSDELLLD